MKSSPMTLVVSLVLSLALLSSVRACQVTPGGCTKAVCQSYSGLTYPDSSWNFSDPVTWAKAQVKPLAIYRGVYDKLGGSRTQPQGSRDIWLSLKGKKALNLEKNPIETAYVIGKTTTSLSGCCDGCRTTQGCVLFLYVPASYTKYTALTGGTCYYLKGGSYKTDGPYNPWDATAPSYGTPMSGSNSQQAPASDTNPMSYVGGFCNPGTPTVAVENDPHFTGAHGTRFDFNGELGKSFCLVTDRRLHINAVLKGYKSEEPKEGADAAAAAAKAVGDEAKTLRSWIREMAVMWTDASGKLHTLHLTARSGKEQKRGSGFLKSASLEGVPMEVPQTEGGEVTSEGFSFKFLGTTKKGPYDLDQFQVRIEGLLDMQVNMRVAHTKLQSADDAQAHFNLVFNNMEVSEDVHGVLGQTYRATASQMMKAVKYTELSRLMGAPVKADGVSGSGFLDGAVQDYETTHVLKPDCKMSSFSA